MIDAQLIAFAGGSLLLAVTPGPDMAVVTKNALAHGRRGVVLTTSGIGVTFAVIGWIWMNVYGIFVARLRDVITTPRVRQWMQRVTGVVLLGFGARLALERV